MHRNYGERMGLSFNKEIQCQYYQNTSVCVEGALLEWIDEVGGYHTRYFGHWLDDSKQDAAVTTRNMCAELCIKGDSNNLVGGLSCGGTVWKGTDEVAVSYRCGEFIYRQGILSAELGVIINAQVEALGHGKWWLDGKLAVISTIASSACVSSTHRRSWTAVRK